MKAPRNYPNLELCHELDEALKEADLEIPFETESAWYADIAATYFVQSRKAKGKRAELFAAPNLRELKYLGLYGSTMIDIGLPLEFAFAKDGHSLIDHKCEILIWCIENHPETIADHWGY